jgi:hypothetical protein
LAKNIAHKAGAEFVVPKEQTVSLSNCKPKKPQLAGNTITQKFGDTFFKDKDQVFVDVDGSTNSRRDSSSKQIAEQDSHLTIFDFAIVIGSDLQLLIHDRRPQQMVFENWITTPQTSVHATPRHVGVGGADTLHHLVGPSIATACRHAASDRHGINSYLR